MSKSQCLAYIAILYGGAVLALFFRAIVKRRLLADHAKLGAWQETGDSASGVAKFILAIPRQFAALRSLGRSISEAPYSVQKRYRRYQFLNWVSMLLIVLMIVFSLTAYKFCGA